MGGVMSSLFPLFDRLVGGKREYRILMLGLDAAGKFYVALFGLPYIYVLSRSCVTKYV